MFRSYLTHFSSIFFLHLFLLFGVNELQHFKQDLSALQLRVISRGGKDFKVVGQKKSNSLAVIPTGESLANNPVSQQVDGEGKGEGPVGENQLLLYASELRRLIDENKFYPPLSKRLGQTGTVVVAFTMLSDGNIINLRIDTSSQFERLDASALEAVKKVQKFRPFPKEFGEEKMEFKVPVKFITI